jgi:membrane-associated protease RseP (regulator of RpoE activity)
MEIIGIIVFALGILVSVCLHEAGHMVTAKAFGMKVTRYFAGFGPTLWSFKRGETEYGLKAIPLGGFVKIVGMTPQDDDVEPGDEKRAMWRYPAWKRTIVMAAGSVTHFALGIVILWVLFAFVSLPNPDRLDSEAVTIDRVATCVAPTVEYDPATRQAKECVAGNDPASLASTMGLQAGDRLIALDGHPVNGWTELTDKVRASGGQEISVTVRRGDEAITRTGTLPTVSRLKQDVANSDRTVQSITPADLESVGVLGITPRVPSDVRGPGAAFGLTVDQTALMFKGTFASLQKFPEKVPKLWDALTGAERDPETPISVVGASRIGGELFGQGEFPTFLLILAGLNFFVGIFNLMPLLPLDGGHIAIAWFEKVRSWIYARLRKPDPGRVDYMKLMPVTYAVILIFGGFTLLTLAADIVNPISLLK